MSDYVRLSDEYNAKLKKIKDSLIATMKRNQMSETDDNIDTDNNNDNANNGNTDGTSSGQPSKKKRRTSPLHLAVGFEEYCTLVTSVGLENLATQSVFRIFDVDGDGSIDVREFLLALIALRSRGDQEEEEAAQLYFSVFDVNEDGHICRDEMVCMAAGSIDMCLMCD